MKQDDFIIIELDDVIKAIHIISTTDDSRWDRSVLHDKLNTADTLSQAMQVDPISPESLDSLLGIHESNSLIHVWSGKKSEWHNGTFKISVLGYMGELSPDTRCHIWEDGRWKTYSASFVLGQWKDEAEKDGLIPPTMSNAGIGLSSKNVFFDPPNRIKDLIVEGDNS